MDVPAVIPHSELTAAQIVARVADYLERFERCYGSVRSANINYQNKILESGFSGHSVTNSNASIVISFLASTGDTSPTGGKA